MQNSGQMVLKRVNWTNWVHNEEIRSCGLGKELIWYRMENQVMSEGVKWELGTQCEIRSYGLEGSQFGYRMQKSSQMVLKGVNLVQNAKIKSNGVERSQLGKLGTQCKNQVICS